MYLLRRYGWSPREWKKLIRVAGFMNCISLDKTTRFSGSSHRISSFSVEAKKIEMGRNDVTPSHTTMMMKSKVFHLG